MHHRVLSALLGGALRDAQGARPPRRDASARPALPTGSRGAFVPALPPRAQALIHRSARCARHRPRMRRGAQHHTRRGDDRRVLVPADGSRASPPLPPARRGGLLEDACARLQAAARAIPDGGHPVHVRLRGRDRVQRVHPSVIDRQRERAPD